MPLVIPIFIAHRGCPHCCLFCNQHAITGDAASDSEAKNLEKEIDSWLKRNHRQKEVHLAYYGGSFSCLPLPEQEKLLAPAQPYLQDGRIQAIRISTRPDCLTEAKLDFLESYGVRTIELGVQSFSDKVLTAARRGHTADDSRQAIRLLQGLGFEVGIQLLPGLPGETRHSFFAGIRETIAFKPALVRLYPAVVLQGSDMAEMYRRGEYQPLCLPQAISWTVRAKEALNRAEIPVVRMGLQPSASLSQQVIAGPYHPAFGELVLSRQWFREIRKQLANLGKEQHLIMYLSSQDLSAVIGEKRKNMERLNALGYGGRFKMVIEKERERGDVAYVVC